MGKTFEKKKVVKNNQGRLSNYDRRLLLFSEVWCVYNILMKFLDKSSIDL